MMGDVWIDNLRGQLWEVWGAFRDEVHTRGLFPLLSPIAPYNRPEFLQPAVAIGGLLGMLLLSGVAVTALGTLLLAMLALWVLLVEVFGLSIEINPLAFAGAAAR